MGTSAAFVYSTLLFIQVLFGINFSTSKIIVEQMDPIIWSNIRFLAAGLLMLAITLISRRKHPVPSAKFFGPLIPLSILGMALGQGLFLFGLKHTSSVNTAVLTTTIPILTLVIVVLRRQEDLTMLKLLGFALAFTGVVLIRDLSEASFGGANFFGDLMVFLGALCFAAYLSFGKKFLQTYDHLWVTTYMFLFSAFFMFLYNIPSLQSFNAPPMDPLFIGCAVYTVVGATLLTYFLNNMVLRQASSARVALFIYFQPVVAGFFGW
ncbi:MAG: EamA family transporter, partial [Bacteriovoracaceae bacterium]